MQDIYLPAEVAGIRGVVLPRQPGNNKFRGPGYNSHDKNKKFNLIDSLGTLISCKIFKKICLLQFVKPIQ